jgi:hypothetical protein
MTINENVCFKLYLLLKTRERIEQWRRKIAHSEGQLHPLLSVDVDEADRKDTLNDRTGAF